MKSLKLLKNLDLVIYVMLHMVPQNESCLRYLLLPLFR